LNESLIIILFSFYIAFTSYPSLKTFHRGYKTSQLMLYMEMIAGFSQVHTKHTNTLCGQNVEYLSVKPGGSYSDQWFIN